MRHYFQLSDDMGTRGRWLLDGPVDEQGRKIDPEQFLVGKSLEFVGKMSCRQLVPGHPLDFSEAALGIPMVSQKLKELLERLGVEAVQFFPVRVVALDAARFALNTTRVVECIDESRCLRVERWKPEDGAPERVGEYRVVERMRIDPSRVDGARFFRTWGWPVLVVSEDLKQAMEKEGITGTKFSEV
ncbi:imm11 family protein [Cystobacter fuscus]